MFQYQDLSANQWYTARLALAHLALSHTIDAAPSSFVSRFQRSGDGSLFLLPFAYLYVRTCCLIRCVPGMRLIGLCLAS